MGWGDWDMRFSDNEGADFDKVRDRYEDESEKTADQPEEGNGLVEETELTRGEIREKLRQKDFLPTRDQVSRAFDDHMDLINFCKGYGESVGEVEHSPMYEIWNKEYIQAFSNYLTERLDELEATPDEPVRIVEVGAGDGKLSAFLKEHMGDVSDRVEIIATDSGEWGGIDQMQDVQSYSAKEAVEELEPEIVISSWMPYKVDFTKDFREQESVQEYILIGETNCTGAKWETWGNKYGMPEDVRDKYVQKQGLLPEEVPPPYKEDGFSIEAMESLSDLQMCRTDYPSKDEWWHSSTLSFKREGVA
jgi:hypothetical protein